MAHRPSVKLPSINRSRHVSLHLAVIALYALVTVLVLNKLIFNLSGLVSSGPLNDYDQFTWNTWWIGYALGILRVNPYFSNYILYPFVHNLTMHTLTPILFPPYALLHPLLGDPATLNVIMCGSFVLGGYATFLFLRRWMRNLTVALLGGLLFAFCPAMIDHAVNYHGNMWLIAWFPIILLLWDRVASAVRWRAAIVWAIIFGIALWGLWMTDLEFLLWMPWLLVPFGFLTLVQARSRAQRIRLISVGILALIVMTALALIAPLPAIFAGDPTGIVSPARYETARQYSLPLSAFFFVPGSDDRGIGRVIIALTLIGLFLRPQRPIRWFWLAIAIPPLILSLGPDTTIGGLLIPLPYRLIHNAFNGLYRWPSRFAPVGLLALLVFVGISFSAMVSRLRWRYLIAAIGVLAILADGNLLRPFAVQAPIKDYAIYKQIGQEQDDYVVLFIPVTAHSGWAEVGGDQGQRAQYLQRLTHKRQINGGLARIPDIEHIFYEQPPLMSFLSGSQGFVKEQPFDLPAASKELTKLITEWPIGYVTIHLAWLDPARALSILGFINTQPDLCFVSQEDDVIAYRARSRGCADMAAAGTTQISFGQTGDEPYLVDGWYPRENISGVDGRWSRQIVQLRIPLKPGRDYDLAVSALAYGANRHVTILANGQNVGTLDLPASWTQPTLHLSASVLGSSGELRLTLQADGESSPAERTGSADTRKLAVAYQWLRVTPAN